MHDSQHPEGTRRDLPTIAAAILAEIDTLNFPGFMKAVDNEIAALASGLTSADLPDTDHREAYDAGWDAKDWAWEVLLNSGFGEEFEQSILEMIAEDE